MTPSEQAKVRMHMVLEAAAKTDEVLKAKVAKREEEARKKLEDVQFPGMLWSSLLFGPGEWYEGSSLEEQVRRIKDIEAIESDSFVPQAFKSSRDDIKLCRLSRDSPDQIKHSFSAVCSDLRRFHQALHCSPPPKRQHPHKSRSRQQPSAIRRLPLSVSRSPRWLCRCRQNTEVIIEMFLSLKEQELDLLGLMDVFEKIGDNM
ncbi:hypothetical protein F7725_020754 [Dissostichus mawsoni]|uniref:Uncharacterized protein n=1 Tax=Dissostichus mawsoni TaxID=36200 RepID=A0A7J5YE26_DISMA|nr:hypothetical protein F7725_020754 [Dissostichus mawsoni]